MRKGLRAFAPLLILSIVIAILLLHYTGGGTQPDESTLPAMSSSEPELPTDLPGASPVPSPSEKKGSSVIIKSQDFSDSVLLRNNSSYELDVAAMLKKGCKLRLSSSAPQILIIHTHSTEAYSPAGLDSYEDCGNCRTLDNNCNVIRVGTELQVALEEKGFNVIHDCGIYDYPSYAGSYGRAETAIRSRLRQNPSISVVIDLHRDAIGDDEVIYKTEASEDGVCSAQLMMIMGSDDSGLEHPDWQENLSFALYLQNAVTKKYPSLMRPLILVPYRYNQHLSHGSIILEVGTNGNTLREALAAVRLFADAIAPSLASLVE